MGVGGCVRGLEIGGIIRKKEFSDVKTGNGFILSPVHALNK